MATMSLLTPSESYRFESALLDFSNGAAAAGAEWAMYTNEYAGDAPAQYGDAALPPRREGSEHLARATKDLMSLDAGALKWNESADRDVMSTDLPVSAPLALSAPFRHPSAPPHMQLHALPPPRRYAQLPHTLSRSLAAQLQRPPPLTVAPSHTLDHAASSDSQRSASSVSAGPTPPPPTPPTLKRPYAPSPDFAPRAGPSAGVGPSPASRPRAKKPRASPPHQNGLVLNAKQTLLTPSQKKANHIQSEQKRRANIRRGYEALCETVPPLREAIRADEEAQAAEEESMKGKGKKKGRGKRAASEAKDKMDGRAGPKSENVVLAKTIDYINDLLSERAVLLDKLNRARSRLAPGHPARTPQTDPLWEREWTGGLGSLDDSGDAGEGDSDDEDDS
ncbi:hypothetical protein DFH11DRAFT_884762 [Phellopilus nigrolimitatus]|nr:hypothetical protein DFH11DRAFT_884762 [Phellopilus nigrolimitatus]